MIAFKQNKLKASVGTPFVVNTNEKRITRNAKRETQTAKRETRNERTVQETHNHRAVVQGINADNSSVHP